MKRNETTYQKATGYHYNEEVKMLVNGVEEVIQVKKYRKPLLSAQKKILTKNKRIGSQS